MFVPFFALPIVVSAFAVADEVPKFDVTESCRGAAAAGYVEQTKDRLQSCLESERRTRETLVQKWSGFPAADRAYCIASMGRFEPTYTELATCLEMKNNLKGSDSNSSEPAKTQPGKIRQPRPQ